jgi:hypothetical protein
VLTLFRVTLFNLRLFITIPQYSHLSQAGSVTPVTGCGCGGAAVAMVAMRNTEESIGAMRLEMRPMLEKVIIYSFHAARCSLFFSPLSLLSFLFSLLSSFPLCSLLSAHFSFL